MLTVEVWTVYIYWLERVSVMSRQCETEVGGSVMGIKFSVLFRRSAASFWATFLPNSTQSQPYEVGMVTGNGVSRLRPAIYRTCHCRLQTVSTSLLVSGLLTVRYSKLCKSHLWA